MNNKLIGPLLEVHLSVLLFSNPGDKIKILVEILHIQDLRV